MTKTEALAVFKRAGYTFTGYKDTGWGCKHYYFSHPKLQGETSYDLALLRKRARHLDIKMWHDEYKAQLRAGIQQELFGPYEYLTEV
jgi:hypothetical protein